jgi:hypothetical protein
MNLLKNNLNKGCFKKGILGLHSWINKNYKKPLFCEKCHIKKRIDLANVTEIYDRNLVNWKWLCRKCHIKFDRRLNKKIINDEIISIKKVKCDEKFYDIETETKNFIANGIITHNSKKSKKSIACHTYLPDVTKEKIDVIIAIDVSGSIGRKELTDFISEIVGMAKAFQSNINMRLLTFESEVTKDYEIKNGNIEKIKKIDIVGGGGTSFINLISYIDEKKIKPKSLIILTDGYGDEITKPNYPILWVLSKGGSDDIIKDKGKVIKLE